MNAGFFTACERLLSATANGVYQGMLLAAIAGLTLRLFARTNAATRHAVWFGVLLLVTALIPAHLLLSSRSHGEIPAATARLAPSSLGVSPGLPVANDSLPDPQPDQFDGDNFDALLYSPSAVPQGEAPQEMISSESRPDSVTTEKPWSRLTAPILKTLSRNLETAISLPHWVCLCLVSLWVALACVRGALIVGRIGEVRRVKTTSSVPSHGLQTLFERLRDSLKARRNVRLRISGAHRGAVVLGFVNPVVLLPAEMDNNANDSEVEHVLRHELAHVDRRDDWGNLAQQIIQAALFFHPAVWWISRRLSLEREIACDDFVLEASGRPRAYALTLANIASRMNHCRHLLAPGVSNNNSQLQQRITMILDTNRDRSPRLARSRVGFFTTATALLAVLAINAGPRLVLAQSPAFPAAAPASGDIAPPSSPDAPLADGAPAVLPPDSPAADSGPRTKQPAGGDYYPQPALPAPRAPGALLAPSPEMPPVAPYEANPAARPVPPTPPTRPSTRHMSVEERLDRIERMLEDLGARDGLKFPHRRADGFPRAEAQVELLGPAGMPVNPKFDFQFKRAAEDSKRAWEEAQRAAEAGQRDFEAGQRNFERAARDFDQKARDFELLAKMGADGKTREIAKFDNKELSEAPLKELQALREARDSLRREMENIEGQIKRIEADQKRPNDATRGRSDSPGETPNPETLKR